MMKYNFSLNVKAEEGEFESIKSEKRISNESLNHYLPFNSEKDNIDNPKYNKNNMFDEILNTDLNNEMKSCKKLKLIHSLLIEIIFINLLFILIVFIIPILYKLTYKENLISIVQDNNMLWVYKCKLEELDFFLSMIYFIFVIILLIIANTISKYECIFSYIIYIKYSLYVLIAFGPTINIFNYLILQNKKYEAIKLIYILNSICYIIIFILFSWDKIYFIIKKDGNNPLNYFIYIKHKECNIHHSCNCGCNTNLSKEDYRMNVEKYINIYKICSKIFIKFN
ncbi:hypothetical protein U3516DRAFT_671521 [Neocallimastix sp. 'constans']